MKNIHVLGANKPSRLQRFFNEDTEYEYELIHKDYRFNNGVQIYITSDEEPKLDEWGINTKNNLVSKCLGFKSDEYSKTNCKKIILSTDPNLIEDGIQAIDDEFLEWFVKNPNCEFVEVNSVTQRSHLTLNDWVDEDENGDFPMSIAGTFSYRRINKIIYLKDQPKKETLEEIKKDLSYWKEKCNDDLKKTPISVLNYLDALESKLKI